MTAKESIPPQVSILRGEKILMTLQRRYASIFTSIVSLVATAFSLSLSSATRYTAQYLGNLEILMTFVYLIIIAVACVFAIIALVGYFYVQGHLYILTNRRIILFRKFITISVREVAYSEITDIIVNQGPIARILDYGSVAPLSPGVRGSYTLPYPYTRRFSYARVELRDVSQPSKIMNELFKLTRSIS